MRKFLRLLLLGVFLCVGMSSYGQALYGTTGLLRMPTADMQRDKTFMLGGGWIDARPHSTHFLSSEVSHTFNYYVNITVFPWLEVGYTCTLVHADHGSTYFPKRVWGKYANQDRAFNFRLRAWKEGWWKEWTPQIVIGADDPGTHSSYGGGSITSGGDKGNNNYLTRFYIVATKHFELQNLGTLGTHAAFIVGRAMYNPHYSRPGFGVNFQLGLPETGKWQKWVNGLNLMAEYDARTINVGGQYSVYRDNINLVAELNDGKYFSGGVMFKLHLR